MQSENVLIRVLWFTYRLFRNKLLSLPNKNTETGYGKEDKRTDDAAD